MYNSAFQLLYAINQFIFYEYCDQTIVDYFVIILKHVILRNADSENSFDRPTSELLKRELERERNVLLVTVSILNGVIDYRSQKLRFCRTLQVHCKLGYCHDMNAYASGNQKNFVTGATFL